MVLLSASRDDRRRHAIARDSRPSPHGRMTPPAVWQINLLAPPAPSISWIGINCQARRPDTGSIMTDLRTTVMYQSRSQQTREPHDPTHRVMQACLIFIEAHGPWWRLHMTRRRSLEQHATTPESILEQARSTPPCKANLIARMGVCTHTYSVYVHE